MDYATVLENRFQRNKTVAENRAKVNRKHADRAIKEINKCRTEINTLLDAQEKELEDAVMELRQKDNAITDQVNETCQTSLNKLSYMKSSLSASKRSNRQKFITLKNAESDLSKLQTEVRDISNNILEPRMVTFRRDEALEQLFKGKKMIGTLTDTVVSCATDFGPLRNALARKETNIRIKCADDEDDCKITAIVNIKQDMLLVADNANYMLKMVDMTTSKFVSGFQMSVCPWDITVLPDDEIALTLPEANKIRIMSTQGNVISKVREFRVSGSCYGIDYKHQKLAVSFCKPSKVELLDLEGNVLLCCQKDNRGYALFATPWYVAFGCDTDRIFVSDHNGGICVLTLTGEFKGSIKDKELVFPTSLMVGENDDVLACGSDSYNVRLVNKEEPVGSGKTILDSKTGVVLPRAICWSPEWKKLFVSSVNGSKEHNNYIQVYSIDALI